MNIANDKLLTRWCFGLFIVSLVVLWIVVISQDTQKLQVNPTSSLIPSNDSQRYFTSGIVQSTTNTTRYTYFTLETFCTVTTKYDTLLYDAPNVSVGDFVLVEGVVNTFNGKSVVDITSLTIT